MVRRRSSSKIKHFLWDNLIFPFIIAFVLSWVANQYLFFKAHVPTGSMIPTIMPDDKLMVTHLHDVTSLERGDIVVFNSKEYGNYFVKRLIGLGGETVDIQEDGSVWIEGIQLEEPYVIYSDTNSTAQTFEIPEGMYLFLGDNRADSLDSRYWKNPYISEEDLLGKVRFRFSPLSQFKWFQ